MIDTIVLNLKNDEFTLLPSCSFRFLEHSNNAYGQAFGKFVLNPTAKDRTEGKYVPRLTKIVRGRESFLKVEFSAPKLVFGNNFDELVDSDFDLVMKNLSLALRDKGVIVWPHQIAKVEPSAIHFSKNVSLTDYVTCSMIISELYKADWSKRLDVTKIKFGNTGESLQIHTNSFELVFYDKIKDLQQSKISEKRAIEKDSHLQLSLFDDQPKDKPLDVLRMEVRLGTKKKIRHILGKVNLDDDLSLKALFDQSVSKAVLQLFWQDVSASMNLLAIDTANTERLLQDMLRRNPGLRLNKALALTTAVTIINKANGGIRRYRQITDPYAGPTSWQKQKKDISKLKLQVSERYQPILELEKSLESFEPLKTIAFTANMLNNDKENTL